MFRFRLFGIPVEIHPSHVLIAIILGHLIARATQPVAGVEVATDGGAAAGSALENPKVWWATLLWSGVLSLAALVNELGQAGAARYFGYKPSIHLVGLGGITRPNANETVPWHREAMLALGGPLLGLTVAGTAFAILGALPPTVGDSFPWAMTALKALALSCGVWATLNLLPVPPLAGGRLLSLLLVRVMGRPGYAMAQGVALLLGVVVLAYAASKQAWLPFIIFLLYIGRVLLLLRGYFQGHLPRAETHPFDIAYLAAVSWYQAQRYDDARKAGEALLEADVQPQLRSKLHALLGWVALKDNQGRAALDHFAQVHEGQISPEALAAAFSLIGDDTRALPLWEAAVARNPDPTLKHELAGTHLRMGNVGKAKAVPQVHLPSAYVCAERVFEARGNFALAGEMLLALCELEPKGQTAFDAACHFARAGALDQSLDALEQALKLGFESLATAQSEPALSPLHSHPRFVACMSRLRQRAPA